MRARDDPPAYPDSLCFRYPATDIFCPVSQPDIKYLHGYPLTAGSFCPIVVGIVYGLSHHGPVQCILPVRIGHGQYTYSADHGDVRTGGLCCLHHLSDSVFESGRSPLLDFGTRVCNPYTDTLPMVYPKRKLATEKDITGMTSQRA